MLRIKLTYLLLCCLLVSNQLIQAQRVLHVDVLVVGGVLQELLRVFKLLA